MRNVLEAELAKAGRSVDPSICPHFPYSRPELFQIIKINRLESYEAVLANHGTGGGCEICRPAVASILASTWNDPILNHANIQGHERPLPGEHPARRHLLGDPARPGRRDHARQARRPRRGREEIRPLLQDHGWTAHRPARRARRPAAGDLARARGRGLREWPRLRQGAAHDQELRRLDLVPLRRAGLDGLRDPHRGALPRDPRAAQDQVRRLRLHPRMRRGAEQGLRPDRDRERLEPLSRRQRRARTRVTRSSSPRTSPRTRP